MVFAPFFAMLGILPNANKAHTTVGASLGFVFVTPIALSFMICIIHGIFTKHMAFDSSLLSTIDAQIDLLIFTFFLMGGMGVSALVFGSLGLGFGGDRLGQAFGQALVFKAMGAVFPQTAGVAMKGFNLLKQGGSGFSKLLESKPVQSFGNKTLREFAQPAGNLMKSLTDSSKSSGASNLTALNELSKSSNLTNQSANQSGAISLGVKPPSYKFKSEAPSRNSIMGKNSNNVSRNYAQSSPQRKSDGMKSFYNQNRSIERNIKMDRNFNNNIERLQANKQKQEIQQVKRHFSNYKPLKSRMGDVMIGINHETPFTKNNNNA